MKASPIITSLNAGELSPTLEGRVDLAKYANGSKVLENFLPLVQGPAIRRGGTRFVQPVKDSTKRTWLIKFEFSATQAFILEFGDGYVRFFTLHGYLLTGAVTAWSNATAYTVGDLAASGGVNYYCIKAHTNHAPPNATYWYALTADTYEIPSPYVLADLTNADGSCALKVVQEGDVIYIANMKRTYEPRKLTRLSNTRWVFSTYQPVSGPLLEQNTTTTTLQASAQTGSITIIASANLFAATDVGRLVRLDVQDFLVEPWETNKDYALNDLVRFDGKTYKDVQDIANSGTSPPIHEQGTAWDGKASVQWQYMDCGYGLARITAYTSPTQVTADVIVDVNKGLQQMPRDVVTTTTKRWQLGAWSATTEYPACVTFFRDRLFWAGKQRLWGSVANDFDDMSADSFGQTTADNAIWRRLQAEDVNDILWIIGLDQLIIGTGGGEFVGSEITTANPLGPDNFKIVRQSKRRCRSVQPVSVGSAVCFVQRAGRKLLALDYSLEIDKYRSQDLAVLAERITRTGIVDMGYQGEPYSIIWCVLSNGKLLGFTYDREQDVMGWHRQPIGGNGFVEAVNVIPTPDGGREEVWIVVRRTINGVTKRYVEYMERPWEGPDEDGTGGDAQADAFYVDAGLTYSGAAATHITGLDHLEGQTVQILADGAVQPSKVVTAGAIDLDRAASKVQIGLQATARLVTMRLEAGSQDGTSQGKIKRIHAAKVRFLDTLGGKVGPYNGNLDDISLRNPATPMNTPPPIASGDQDVDFSGDYETDCRVEIRQDQPLPMTVAALLPRLRTYDP